MIQNFASSAGPHISIGPEVLWHIGPLPITNANVLGIIGSALVAWLLISTARKAANGKKMNRLQSMTMKRRSTGQTWRNTRRRRAATKWRRLL